ncbi:MAG TPA: 3-deoxy-7-phosphoheptulonate synthase, partial [Firmicutes bacterium]|nr:3-deoxy-7-phosphoheptulonate synthase [Bacillota bacterium]
MFITLKKDVSKDQVDKVVKKIRDLGFQPHLSKGAEVTVVGVIGENAIVYKDVFEAFDSVASITPISKPYKLVCR